MNYLKEFYFYSFPDCRFFYGTAFLFKVLTVQQNSTKMVKNTDFLSNNITHFNNVTDSHGKINLKKFRKIHLCDMKN